MEENKKRPLIKINLLQLLLILLVIAIISSVWKLISGVDSLNQKQSEKPVDLEAYTEEEMNNIQEYDELNNSESYYYIYTEDIDGKTSKTYGKVSLDSEMDYDIEVTKVNVEKNPDFIVNEYMNYEKYYEFCKNWNIEQKYEDQEKQYLVVTDSVEGGLNEAKFVGFEQEKDGTNVYTWLDSDPNEKGNNAYVVIVPVEKMELPIKIVHTLSKTEYYSNR